MVAKMPTDW